MKVRFEPTEEQQAVVEVFKTGTNLVVEAGAGTGKTATLVLLAEQTRAQGVYFAYNRAIAEEAKSKFPFNVRASTAHSLAFRAIGKLYAHRLNGPRLPARVAAQRMGIGEPLQLPGDKAIMPAHLARIVTETIQKFSFSADREITRSHVPFVLGLDLGQLDVLRPVAVQLARRAWEDIESPQGTLKFEHDHYLKIWGLSGPRLNADFIMLDEAQDANPVLADIVARQTHAQRILVGDSNQAIYGWRGAIDAMSDFEGERLYLTQSFRFGPAVADEANKWLTLLNSPLRLRGFDKIASTLDLLTEPDAILCRTNAGAVSEAISQHASGRKAALVGGGESIRRLAQAAQQLQQTGQTDHPELFIFDSWAEVQEYTQEDAAGSDLRVFVKLIDTLGAAEVITAIDQLSSEDSADVVISTAHKAKGREWPKVRVSTDFYQPDEGKLPSREEMMLSYVTVTRAKEVLDRGGLSYVDAIGQSEESDLTAPVGEATVHSVESAAEPQGKEPEMADKGVRVVGKQKGHVVEALTVPGDRLGIKIVSWTLPDGKPAPKKAADKLIGKTFEGVSLAGKRVFEVMHEHYNTPENLQGRWMIFKEEGGKRAVSGNGATATRRPKAAVTAEKEEKARKKIRREAAKLEKAAKPARAKTTSRRMVIEKIDDQEGVAKGKTKFWCNACAKSFVAKAGATPKTCPKGHKQAAINDDFDLEVEEPDNELFDDDEDDDDSDESDDDEEDDEDESEDLDI